MLVNTAPEVGRNESRRTVFADDCRSLDAMSALKFFAVVNSNLHLLAVDPGRPRTFSYSLPSLPCCLHELRLRPDTHEDRSDIHQFDIHSRTRIAVTPLVSLMEHIHKSRCEWNSQFIRLPAIPQIGEIARLNFRFPETFGRKFRMSLLVKFLECRLQFRIRSLSVNKKRPGIVLPHIRKKQTQRGQRTGKLRNDHALHSQSARQMRRVQPARSAKTEQGEIAGIVASLDRNDADG